MSILLSAPHQLHLGFLHWPRGQRYSGISAPARPDKHVKTMSATVSHGNLCRLVSRLPRDSPGCRFLRMRAHLQIENSNKRYTNETTCHLRLEAKRPSSLPSGSSISEFTVYCTKNSITEASTETYSIITTLSGCNQADTYQHLQTSHCISLATRLQEIVWLWRVSPSCERRLADYGVPESKARHIWPRPVREHFS